MIPIGDSGRVRTLPLAVYGIVALNVYVFVREVTAAHPDAFINAFAAIPYDIAHNIVLPSPSPQWPPLTLITSQFIHASALHIGFNMLFLIVFGPDIEYVCGHIGFVAFYLFCGVAGGIVQMLVSAGSHVPSIGASGAIAGVLGAYIVTFPTNSIRAVLPIGCFPVLLRVPAVLIIGIWAAAQFVTGFGAVGKSGADHGGIAYFAHIGGFLTGLFTIGLFKR
jgi:rhomboid family protein